MGTVPSVAFRSNTVHQHYDFYKYTSYTKKLIKIHNNIYLHILSAILCKLKVLHKLINQSFKPVTTGFYIDRFHRKILSE